MVIDKNKVTFRKVNIGDVETLIHYRLQFLKDIQGQQTVELENRLIKSLREYFTNSLKNETFIAWIAEYDNKSISFGGIVIREQPGNYEVPNGRTGYMLNMYTIPEYRKNGIGTMLFQKLIEEGKANNLDKIELGATLDGEPIYRRFGFSVPHDKVLEIKLK